MTGFSVPKSTHKSPEQNKSFEPKNYGWMTHGNMNEVEQEDGIQSSIEETATNGEECTDVGVLCIATLFSYTQATL